MLRTPPSRHLLSGRLLSPDELDDRLITAWRALCSGHESYDSALMQPEFTQIVSSVRDDVRIAIYEAEDEVLGVFPMHVRPGGLARPIGAPFDDYSGPILSRDIDCDLVTLLELAGLSAYQAFGALDPWDRLAPSASDENSSAQSIEPEHHVIRPGDLSDDAFLEQQRSAHAKRFKNFRRLQNRAEREVGDLQLRWGQPEPDALNSLLRFKGQQFIESGLVNLVEATDARRVLDAVAASENGFLVTLWFEGQLISGHFGIRVGEAFHPWVAAFDPAFSDYSPGNLLIMQIIKNMREMGLKTYDLAQGHDHYKKYFCNDARPSREIFATAETRAGKRYRRTQSIWKLLGADREQSYFGRLRRRMNHIAVSELGTIPRVREFGYAVLARLILRRKR